MSRNGKASGVVSDSSQNQQHVKYAFVTVGSTKFEALIDTVLSADVLTTLKAHGFRRLVLQVGNGKHADDHLFNFTPDQGTKSEQQQQQQQRKFLKHGVEVVAYRYKSSIDADMAGADLVISHAGAGSVLGALDARRRLVVVVNETLMDNHQRELAEKMFEQGFLLYTNCAGLRDKIELMSNEQFLLTPYTPGNPLLFGNHINKLFQHH